MFTKQMSTTESDSIGKVGLMRNICQNDAQNRRNVQNLKENSGMIVVLVLSLNYLTNATEGIVI